MRKEKLANYLLDVSKYVFTGVVISALFKDFADSKIFVYGFGIVVSVLALLVGLVLLNKEESK